MLWVCNALSTVYYGILAGKEKNSVLPTSKTSFNTGWTVSTEQKSGAATWVLSTRRVELPTFIHIQREREKVNFSVCGYVYNVYDVCGHNTLSID